jgi:hypothetical protein
MILILYYKVMCAGVHRHPKGRRKRKIDQTFSYQNGISVTFNLILILIMTGAGAPQLCRRARTRHASALARRSARSEHMGTSTDIVSEIVSPGFCAHLP